MRMILAASLVLASASLACAQSAREGAQQYDPATSSPAPVPSISPETARGAGIRAPAEERAPAPPSDPADTRAQSGPRDSTPLSAAPPNQEGRATPDLSN